MTHDYDRLHERVSPQNEIVVADSLDARQQEQSHEWQAEQKEGKKHENDAHGLEVKALLEELRRLLLPIELCSEPTIEGIAVVDPLLSGHCGKAFSSNSELTRFGIFFCALSSPLCCLVSAPRSGDGNEGEDQRFEN